MSKTRGGQNLDQRAKKKAPLPEYYIVTGRSEAGLPKIISQTVQQKQARPGIESARSTTPSRSKKPYTIYKAKLNPLIFLVIVGYAILPTLTAIKLPPTVDWRYLTSGLILIWIVTWFLYASDKMSAKTDSWRISENTLHLFEFIGGWPAAFLAQQRFRHKTRKTTYQITFWTIGILHQITCIIFLTNPKALTNILSFTTK